MAAWKADILNDIALLHKPVREAFFCRYGTAKTGDKLEKPIRDKALLQERNLLRDVPVLSDARDRPINRAPARCEGLMGNPGRTG